MADEKKEAARVKASEKQAKVTKQWQSFASKTGRDAYEDLMQYCEDLKAMYLKYCEEQAMPHPDPVKAAKGEVIPIDHGMIASLLQARRGCGMVQTYIRNRVDTNVAQSIKK